VNLPAQRYDVGPHGYLQAPRSVHRARVPRELSQDPPRMQSY
jgi:hypothetical protein